MVPAAMFFAGCQKEMEPVEPKATGTATSELVFIAGSENDADTKTALASDGFSVNFQSGDAINVFDGTNNIQFSTTSTGAEATFEKKSGSDPVESETYYAHYPYGAGVSLSGGKIVTSIPALQEAPNGSFDPRANISVAKAAKIGVEDIGGGKKQAQYRLTFLNVGNLVKFHFTEDSNVTAIVIKCNANQNLTGTIKVNPMTGEYDRGVGDITDGSTTITLKPSGSLYFLEGDYYAVMLPQVHGQGISIKMEHSEGSYHFKRGGVKDLEMKRNKIYQLYSGDITKYTEAAILPSLYMHDGKPHNGNTYPNLTGVTRISFHAMAQDADWNYADANNILNVMGTSDVRGYVDNGTLHIWTKKGMFSIPENDVQAGTADGTQMFNNYQSVTAIDNLSYIDVTFLHSFKNMFYNCNKLQSIDISGWDTSAATDMSGMFNTHQTSSLRNVILGEHFVLKNPLKNMFGINGNDRGDGKVRVSCTDDVYTQFENYDGYESGDELYKKQVTWNHGAGATLFGEFLNPTIVATSINENVYFTFTIGGNIDALSLPDITVGFDGYTPTASQYTSQGKQTIDGIEYDMYTLNLTSNQKNDRRVITQVRAQDSGKNPTHVIISANNFTTVKFESRIYPQPYSADVQVAPNEGDKANTNFISGLSANDWKEYSGKNWPIVGQPCNVTFYLQNVDGFSVDAVKLNNGTTIYACTQSGLGAPAGYTAWTANNVMVSNICEEKKLKVQVQVDGQRVLYDAGDVTVKVYGITLGAGMNTVSSFSVNTTDVYVIKSNTSGRFLYTDGNTATSSVKTKPADFPDNYCFWQFNPGSSPVKLLTYNTTTQRYLTSGFQASDRSGNAASWTVSDGLKFANGTSGGKTRYMREATVSSTSPTAVSLATFEGQNVWTVYHVSFDPPVTP